MASIFQLPYNESVIGEIASTKHLYLSKLFWLNYVIYIHGIGTPEIRQATYIMVVVTQDIELCLG